MFRKTITPPTNVSKVYSTSATTYTIPSDAGVILADTSSNSTTATLPTASLSTNKIITLVKTAAANTLVISGAGKTSSTLDEQRTFISTGSTWTQVDWQAETNWVAYTPTYTGFGTSTHVLAAWRRERNELVVQGMFINATGTGVEARISFPSGLTAVNTTPLGTNTNVAGTLNTDAAGLAGAFALLSERNVAYFTFGFNSASAAGLAKQQGTGLGAGQRISFTGRVPIATWES